MMELELDLSVKARAIHEHAVDVAKKFLVKEADLLAAIIEVDRFRIHEKFGEPHLTPYCVKHLGLSEDVAGVFVRVARKSRVVPALKMAVYNGDLTVSKAKAIASVISSDNQDTWIEKAKNLSKRNLELEVARIAPGALRGDRTKVVTAETVRVEFDQTLAENELLRRAQDIASQKLAKPATLAETLKLALELFLDREDPVRKAKRSIEKDQSRDRSLPIRIPASPKSIPAASRHAVNARDSGRCQAKLPDGSICGSTKWVHHHHIVSKEDGGKDLPENLVTLCSAHHRQWHAKPPRRG